MSVPALHISANLTMARTGADAEPSQEQVLLRCHSTCAEGPAASDAAALDQCTMDCALHHLYLNRGRAANRTSQHTSEQFESSLIENSKKAEREQLQELTRDLDTLTVESKKRAAAAAAAAATAAAAAAAATAAKNSAAAAAARLAAAKSAAAKRSAAAAAMASSNRKVR